MVKNFLDPTFESVAIAQGTTAATLVLKAGATGKIVRLHRLCGTLHAAGSIKIESKPAGTAVALTGAMTWATNGGQEDDGQIDPKLCLATASGSALQITTSAGAFNGYAIISSDNE